MKRSAVILALGTLIGVSSQPASAADMYMPEMPAIWSGWYLGAYGTYGFGDADFKDPDNGHIAERLTDANSNDVDGFGGGIKSGYLIQDGSLVYGLEGYAEFYDQSDCVNTAEQNEATGCPYGHSIETDLQNSFGLNAKVGVASGNSLFYGLLGVNFGKIKSKFNDWTFAGSYATFDPVDDADPQTGDTLDSKSSYEVGLRLGGGIEHKFSDNLSLFAEGAATWYQDQKFSAPNVTFEHGAGPTSLSTSLTNVTVAAGLNYHF
jgi:opacity protein-like surface antigen